MPALPPPYGATLGRRWRGILLAAAARAGLALLSPALVVLSLPDTDQGWLAWVALVPLLLACHGLRPLAASALGLVTGGLSALGVFHWMFEVPGFRWHHALILGGYLGLYPAAWCAALPLLARTRLPFVLTAPASWVALDYLRAHAGFLALPWGTLAHSQHGNLPVLQVATLAGEPGVTFLVAMGSAAVARLLATRAWREAAVAGAVIAAAHAAGGLALMRATPGPPVRVAVVQPSILLAERRTAAARAATLERLERLSAEAAASRPALIAWPETAVRDLTRDPTLVARVRQLADAVGTPLVVGASEFVKFAPEAGETRTRVRLHNAAFLVEPGRPPGEPYRKIVLVPFGEYVPLEGLVQWPAWLVPASFDSVPGETRRLFTLPDGTAFAPLICWENLFAGFVRLAVLEGAQVLVQLTNDNWFGPTAAPRQHNLASILRAVENRTPVVIASNTGPSQIIDPYGRVVARVPGLFVEGVTTADVSRRAGTTPYTRHGDPLALAVIAGTGLVLGLAVGGLGRRARSASA